jgi:hypothetical protein
MADLLDEHGYDWVVWPGNEITEWPEAGERVALRPHDAKDHRGVVVDWIREGEAQVRMDADGRVRRVKSKELRKCYRIDANLTEEHKGRVLLVSETTDYRSAARAQVFSADVVVEVGSSYGDTSTLLARHAKRTLHFDNGAECIEEASRRYPEINFECVDCFLHAALVQEKSKGCNVVFIDIGGSRVARDQLEMLIWAQQNLVPKLVVLKSRLLFQALQQRQGGCDAGRPLANIGRLLTEAAAEGEGAQESILATKDRKRASRAGKRKKTLQKEEYPTEV